MYPLREGVYHGYTPLVIILKCTQLGYIFRYTPTSFIYTYKFFTRGIHEIYTPAIEQSDWSECTSHGTSDLLTSYGAM